MTEGKLVSLRVDPAEIHLFEPSSAEDPYGRSLQSPEGELVSEIK